MFQTVYNEKEKNEWMDMHEWFKLRSLLVCQLSTTHPHQILQQLNSSGYEYRECIIELLSSFDFLQLLRVVVVVVEYSYY